MIRPLICRLHEEGRSDLRFQALEPSAYLAKGQIDLTGLFIGAPGKHFVLLRLDAEGEHPFATVHHEYTHYLMRKADWLPLWLNEGMAEFYQNTDIRDKDGCGSFAAASVSGRNRRLEGLDATA